MSFDVLDINKKKRAYVFKNMCFARWHLHKQIKQVNASMYAFWNIFTLQLISLKS